MLRRVVNRAAAIGLTQEDTAKLIGISESTLQRRMAEDFKEGMVDYDGAVVRNLRRHALGAGNGAVTAAIYWTKVRLGWKEKQAIEHSFAGDTLAKIVSGFLDILHRAIPDFCPGCNTALALKPKIAALLIDESKKLSGAMAATTAAPAPEGQSA